VWEEELLVNLNNLLISVQLSQRQDNWKWDCSDGGELTLSSCYSILSPAPLSKFGGTKMLFVGIDVGEFEAIKNNCACLTNVVGPCSDSC